MIFLAGCFVNIIIIFIEAKLYPDRVSIEEDKKEDETMPDNPYTCMFNPIIPSIGIWGSGAVIGYLDTIVWQSFFGIVILIAISYFIYVIPRKYGEKMKKASSRFGSIYRRSQKA